MYFKCRVKVLQVMITTHKERSTHRIRRREGSLVLPCIALPNVVCMVICSMLGLRLFSVLHASEYNSTATKHVPRGHSPTIFARLRSLAGAAKAALWLTSECLSSYEGQMTRNVGPVEM
jgi:hypothetical protein